MGGAQKFVISEIGRVEIQAGLVEIFGRGQVAFFFGLTR